MGQAFSLPRLLGVTDATASACLDRLEADLLLTIVRLLIRDEPAAVGRLICCCRTLSQLASADTEEGEELRKARRAVARQWLFDLRLLAAQQPAALMPLVTQVSRRLSFGAMRPEIDEPDELDLTRWRRPHRPAQDDHERGTALKRVLYANRSLTSIDMSVSYLTHMDATEIAMGLMVNRSLTTLNASGNFIGGYGRDGRFVRSPEGVDALAAALSVSTIRTLNLSENRLGAEGVKALVPGLASTSLTSLDLSRNSLGAEGAAELAAGLGASASLLKLDVRLNKLGSEGAEALAPGVAACRSLMALDARFNGVEEGDEGEDALKEAAKDRGDAFELLVLNVFRTAADLF